MKVSEIFRELANNGGGVSLYYNDQLEWDLDLEEIDPIGIHPSGWSEPIEGKDIYYMDVIDRGHQSEFYLTLRPYGKTVEGKESITEIIRNLAQKGGGTATKNSDSISFDRDIQAAKYEILIEAIIPNGWDFPLVSCDQMIVDRLDKGHEQEFSVTLFPTLE